MTYDIFISYKRRDTSSAMAALLYNYLMQRGYSVFLDTKEGRQGRFDEQLYGHIENAKDIIILLEESSLRACFSEIADAYKTDWFCLEIMHALQFEREKHLIPILIGGYSMPDPDTLPEEMRLLPVQNAISMGPSDMDDVFQKYFVNLGYLQSQPRGVVPGLGSGVVHGEGIADFLFYSDFDCDVFECGEKLFSMSSENDESHPYRYGVARGGEHRFRCVNNDTCEVLVVVCHVDVGSQQYVELAWTRNRNLWGIDQEGD